MAVILREHNEQTGQSDLLFIQRANRDGDPWSGQMAFPGGHREAEDPSLLAAAMRETHEEIGVQLHSSHCIGRLNDLIHPRLHVAGFVFETPKIESY
ncbi:MAG: NUDIX domain-containing protein, partial [Pseudomonadales bacterium]|nr:NUDIX domain-containing protein [Pseudomonadales bacterium]